MSTFKKVKTVLFNGPIITVYDSVPNVACYVYQHVKCINSSDMFTGNAPLNSTTV
jgi:hypothetical protein